MKSLFNEDAYQEIKNRLTGLTEKSTAQWGKMSVAEMLWHCQVPLNIMLKKVDYPLKTNWLAKTFFKKTLYSDKPWPKNLPTAKPFKNKEQRSFELEKPILEALIDETFEQGTSQEWGHHPVFGYFTNEQWGKMQYKHLDHHLKQFGA
jgi:hypothetical protein